MSGNKTWIAAALSGALGLAAPARLPAAPGETSLDFLRLEVGPRQIAMGGAAAAVPGDSYASIYNPALLGELSTNDLAFSHVEWLLDTTYQDLLYSHYTRLGNVAARFQRLDYGDISGYDATGSPNGSFSASDQLAAITYARRLHKSGLSLGSAAKFAREKIGSASANAFLADLGASFTPLRTDWLGDCSLGLSIRNLGQSVRFDQNSESAPREVILGLSRRFWSESLVVAADTRLPKGQGPSGHLGAEFRILNTLELRAGFNITQDEGPGVRAGMGFLFHGLQVDYAFLPVGVLGQTHHIAIRRSFGGPGGKAYREGMRLMSQQDYAEAILKFNEELEIAPQNVRAQRRLREAYELMKKEEGR